MPSVPCTEARSRASVGEPVIASPSATAGTTDRIHSDAAARSLPGITTDRAPGPSSRSLDPAGRRSASRTATSRMVSAASGPGTASPLRARSSTTTQPRAASSGTAGSCQMRSSSASAAVSQASGSTPLGRSTSSAPLPDPASPAAAPDPDGFPAPVAAAPHTPSADQG